jgi:hypothetical protein
MELEDAIHIRTVNGDGPPCGCGKPSRLRHHVGALSHGITARDIFLCVRCAQRAMEGFVRITGQKPYGATVVSAKYQGYWCPDCGATGTHKDTCSYFPSQPVVHGNREPPPWEAEV